MPVVNIGILNTIIAMVIVLLVLSLIVQAVQMFLKKLLKLKSKQLIESLEDLYDQALSHAATGTVDTAAIATAGSKSPAKQFTETVLEEFRNIGRESKWGYAVLDSLSKEDLLKIMAKLESERFVPDYVTKFQEMYDELNRLQTAIEALATNTKLTGAASAKLAEIRVVLAPIFNDVQSILEGGKVRPKVLFGDLLRLGKLKLSNVPELLNEAQQAINQEVQVATPSNPALVTDLRGLSTELARLAALIGNLSQKFDNAVAPLRMKLEQVETWYDTVMQSFDERYARHMRSVALYISIVVVILLNADFFRVYSSLSKNEVQKNLIVQSGQKVLEDAKKANPSATVTPSPTPRPTRTPGATPMSTPTPDQAAASTSNPPITTPTASPSPTVDIVQEAKETKENIDVYVSTYQDFGFSPLTAAQVRDWFQSLLGRTLTRNEKGVPVNTDKPPKAIPSDCAKPMNCTPLWRDQSS